MISAADKKALQSWEEFAKTIRQATPVDYNEDPVQKKKRIESLEADAEAWFKYYFPNYATAEPAKFHKRSTKRFIENRRWFEVRMWSRELAKSTRTMMEVLYLSLAKGELKNILLISNSEDNAIRLLTPYKLNLQNNQRLINDYGLQEKPGYWTDSEFTTRTGISFRALGAGQSPRGTRNEAWRVDAIIFDDCDTDEECRNEDRVKNKFKWMQEAVIPTVSVSGYYRIWVCGNNIAKVCSVNLLAKLANYVDKVNIRDKNGKSSWPEKNSEADIDAILSIISYLSAQKEYYNNPLVEGTTFKKMHYKQMRPLREYKFLVAYGDPSFKDTKKNDFKAVTLIGKWQDEFHIIKAYCEQTTTAKMIDWYYQIEAEFGKNVPIYYFMEANFIQDIILQEFHKESIVRGKAIPIKGDTRKKAEKFTRIESVLEPLNSNGKLFLNEAEKSNPHMITVEEQFLALAPGSRAHDDAPDSVEGGVSIINTKTINNTDSIVTIGYSKRGSKRY